MRYEHCCFISYKNPPVERHFLIDFVHILKDILEYYLNTNTRPYIDVDLRSKPGVHYPSELSKKLCKSVCMIAILTPEYIESTWCTAEWKAMEFLEAKRLQNKKGLIIPIIFRGNKNDFLRLIGERESIELISLLNPIIDLKKRHNLGKIMDIARMIDDYCKKVTDTHENCDEFIIKIEEEIVEPIIEEPSPFGS